MKYLKEAYDLLLLNFNQKQPSEVSCKKGYLKNFTKFTGKYLCQSLFSNNVAGLPVAASVQCLFALYIGISKTAENHMQRIIN